VDALALSVMLALAAAVLIFVGVAVLRKKSDRFEDATDEIVEDLRDARDQFRGRD